MAYCVDSTGAIQGIAVGGVCPAGQTLSGQTTGQTGQQTGGGQQSQQTTPDVTAGAWMPKPIEALNIQGGGYGLQEKLADPNNYSATVPTSTANTMYMMFPQYNGLFSAIAKAQGGRSGSAAYEKFVTQSAYYNSIGIKKSPFDLATDYAIKHGIQPLGAGGAGGSGSRGAAGPKPLDMTSVQRAMDSVATNLLGRSLSDQELKQYYSHYVSTFSGNPDVDVTQDATNQVKKQDDYQEYQIASKFSKAMSSVMKGAS